MLGEAQQITSTDIRYILENPWGISQYEWILDNQGVVENVLYHITTKLDQAKKDGYFKFWKTDQSLPVAILVCYKFGVSKYETLFVASKHFEGCAMKVSREIREILIEQSLNFPGCTCGLYSISEHPKQIAWFRFLGFTYEPKGNIGNSRYFEFKAPSTHLSLTE